MTDVPSGQHARDGSQRHLLSWVMAYQKLMPCCGCWQEGAQEAVGSYARVLKDEHNMLIGRKMGLLEYDQVHLQAPDSDIPSSTNGPGTMRDDGSQGLQWVSKYAGAPCTGCASQA